MDRWRRLLFGFFLRGDSGNGALGGQCVDGHSQQFSDADLLFLRGLYQDCFGLRRQAYRNLAVFGNIGLVEADVELADRMADDLAGALEPELFAVGFDLVD